MADNLDGTRSRWMTYDALDRLTDAGSPMFGGDHWHRFSYDAIDNLRSWKLAGVKDYANYVYNAENRLAEVRNTPGNLVHQFIYDVQGNITSRNSVPHDFDYGNRLRAVPGIETYRYDGSGRRVQTTKASGAITKWMYAQNGQLLFWSKLPAGGGQTTHENVYLGGSLVATIDHHWPSNTIIATKYQHTDALGSPVAVSNEAGVVIESERANYDPYGGAINRVVDGVGYTGHVMDPATGLTYMQQRYYDPAVGRFLSIDPVTASSINGGNFNRYWYANNNPYKFVDPDGRRSRCGISCDDEREDLRKRGRPVPQGGSAEMPGDARIAMGNLTMGEARTSTRIVETIVGEPGASLADFDEQVHERLQSHYEVSGVEFVAKYGERIVSGGMTQYGATIQSQGSHVMAVAFYGPVGFKPLKMAAGQTRTMHNHGKHGMPANGIDLQAMPGLGAIGSRRRPLVPKSVLNSFSRHDGPGLLSHPDGYILKE